MDKNKDGVVTLEEFVLACQEVGAALRLSCPLPKNHCLHEALNSQLLFQLLAAVLFDAGALPSWILSSPPQDETMMRSMQLFENVM